jgi:hypothetical protein
VVSRLYDTALRETLEATVLGVTGGHPHLFSAAGTSRAGLPLRPPLHTRNLHHSDWRATTHTSNLPSSAAERSPAEAFAIRRMRSSPLAERKRPGPVTVDEPTVQNPSLPQVPACRDSHSSRTLTAITTTTATAATNINNNNNNKYYYYYCYFCYFERKVAAPV